jgi:hypothetical protein
MYSTRFNGCLESKSDHKVEMEKKDVDYYQHTLLHTHTEGGDHKVTPLKKKHKHTHIHTLSQVHRT